MNKRHAMIVTRLWSNVLGVVAVLPLLYFWAAFALPGVWRPIFPGAGFLIVSVLLLGLAASVVAGYLGSRRWYLVTAAVVGTCLFVGFRMH